MDRDKALDVALSQIEKQFGKGAVMKMGEDQAQAVAAIPTGALSLDVALGIGGLPRGRVVEIYGPESSGKCLVADTQVWTDAGLETLEELFRRAGHPVADTTALTDVREHGIRLVNERTSLEGLAALTHNGRQSVWRVELDSGRSVTATANHPLRVASSNGAAAWREVGDLRAGDLLLSALFGAEEAPGSSGLTVDEAVVLGYVTADRDLAPGEGPAPERYGEPAPPQGPAGEPMPAGGTPIETVPAQDVPYAVRTGGAKAQRAFLSALFERAAHIGRDAGIEVVASCEPFAEQVQLLLYGLGVPAVRRTRPASGGSQRHVVRIAPDAGRDFLDRIGFRSRRRGEQAGDAVPHDAPQAAQRSLTPAGPEPAESGVRYPGPVILERITAITPAGQQPTFDVVLPRTHSFVANGVLSHNTTVALHVIAEAQKQGGIAAFIDAEHALDPTYAAALGVDVDELLVSQPDTGEQALEIADMLIRSGAIDVIVVDSVAALTPRAEIEGEMGDTHVGLQARLMSQALRKLAGSLNRSRTCAVFINQLREKIGVMFGSPETTPGGRALKFYSSVRLDVRRIESLKDGTNVVGNRVRVKVVKNKVAPPFRQAEFDIMYGEGVSREGSLLDVGVDGGIIRKAGAWYTYEGEQLGQGRENARTFLKEHDDVALEIEKRVKEALGISPAAATDGVEDAEGG